MSNRFVPAICAACNKPFSADVYGVASGRGRFCSMSCAKTVDISGRVFGFLTVLRREGTKSTYATWLCRCVCGTEKEVAGNDLRSGATKSCGCKRKEMQVAKVTRHGRTHSRLWNSWMSMRHRCQTTSDPSYPRYGGRGIKVCERWESFENFQADMGERPPGKTIDRIDNDGNYEPSNCRWASAREQGSNRRTNHTLVFAGQELTISDWARKMNLTKGAISERLRHGWTVEAALTTAKTVGKPSKTAERSRRSNQPAR